jgi:hypothetical protein
VLAEWLDTHRHPDGVPPACPFRRIRPPIPLEGGQWSERSDAYGSWLMEVAAMGRRVCRSPFRFFCAADAIRNTAATTGGAPGSARASRERGLRGSSRSF